MEKGINVFCCGDVSENEIDAIIKRFLKNGISHTFCRSDHPTLTDDVIKKIKRSGIEFDTLHLPFKGINALYEKGEESEKMYKLIISGIERCAKHEIKIGVLHTSSGKNPPFNDTGAERFDGIIERAKELGVKIAFENLRTLGNLALNLEKYPQAGFCWDTGHESCFTPGLKFMPLFGKRIETVHIHDNRGIFDKDDHMIPFDGKIDFESVAKELACFNYRGTLMLELVKSRHIAYSLLTDDEYVNRASFALIHLENLIKSYR